MVAAGSFREDLYFRLSAFKLTIPPLRERPLDILPLVEQFINQQTTEGQSVRLTTEAQELLVTYQWPGNVRELGNVIYQAMIMTDSDSIVKDSLPNNIKNKIDLNNLLDNYTIKNEFLTLKT